MCFPGLNIKVRSARGGSKCKVIALSVLCVGIIQNRIRVLLSNYCIVSVHFSTASCSKFVCPRASADSAKRLCPQLTGLPLLARAFAPARKHCKNSKRSNHRRADLYTCGGSFLLRKGIFSRSAIDIVFVILFFPAEFAKIEYTRWHMRFSRRDAPAC